MLRRDEIDADDADDELLFYYADERAMSLSAERARASAMRARARCRYCITFTIQRCGARANTRARCRDGVIGEREMPPPNMMLRHELSADEMSGYAPRPTHYFIRLFRDADAEERERRQHYYRHAEAPAS